MILTWVAKEYRAVAKINGERITQRAYMQALQEKAGKPILDSLIDQALIRQVAEKEKIVISDKEIEEELSNLKALYPSEIEFQDALKQYNVTEADLKDEIRQNLILRKLAEREVKITDEDIQKYFEENKELLDEPEKVKVRYILVEKENEAQDIYNQIVAGEDFARLAREKSIDPATRSKGGERGFIARGEMPPEFEDVAFSLNVDEISEPVKTDLGYYIIKVDEKKAAQKATLENSREKIKKALLTERSRPVTEVLKDLRAKAEIKINLPYYEAENPPQAK